MNRSSHPGSSPVTVSASVWCSSPRTGPDSSRSASAVRYADHNSASASMPAASLAGKMREKVLLETSASSASSSRVVASKPLVVNKRSAASASARRFRSFLRSRSGSERSVAA